MCDKSICGLAEAVMFLAVQSCRVWVAVHALAECRVRVPAPRLTCPWVWQHYCPALACFGWHLWKLETVGLKHPFRPHHLLHRWAPSFACVQEALRCSWKSCLKALCCCPWLFAGVGVCTVPVADWALQLPELLLGMRRGFALAGLCGSRRNQFLMWKEAFYFLKWRIWGSLRYQGQISTMTRGAACQTLCFNTMSFCRQ